jgi:hypothetical protein
LPRPYNRPLQPAAFLQSRQPRVGGAAAERPIRWTTEDMQSAERRTDITGRDPDHTILPEAWRWEIIGLNIQLAPKDESEPYLDLTLRRGLEQRRLRFWSPQQLVVEEGGPANTSGLSIQDVSARGLDRIGVRVDDLEGSHGAVRFWARAVEGLP